MLVVYILLYIHTDKPEYSEVLGVYDNKDTAVDALLEKANYRDKNGQLTQYMQLTDEYKSFDVLREQVYQTMELCDTDIYRITRQLIVRNNN